jgi:hypothetical protein
VGHFPYVFLPDGQAAGGGRGPAPSLAERVKQQLELSIYNAWLGQALPLDEEMCVVSLFHQLMRGGTKGAEFVFARVAYDGRLLGRLDGLDQNEDSPYVDHHYRLAVDRPHRRIVYKTKTAVFLFDFDGRLLAKVPLEGPLLKTLAPMKLGCCGPQGQPVLHHPKQHLILAMDPVDDPSNLKLTLTEAAAAYKKETAKLKKNHQPIKYRWLYDGEPIRH